MIMTSFKFAALELEHMRIRVMIRHAHAGMIDIS